MKFLLLAAALLGCVAGDAIPDFVTRGKCAAVKVQDNFDLRKYAGRWYITEMIDIPYLPTKRCAHSFYEYSDTDYGFNVRMEGFGVNNDYLKMRAKLYPTKEFPAAHMLMDSPTVFATPFKVVETDYETYSCVYACISFDNYKAEFAFVYSRTPQNNGPATEKCAAVFNRNGVEFSKFETVPQTAECVYRA